MDLTQLTLLEARALLRAREISAVELTDAYLARIAALEPRLRAFVTVTADLARLQARAADVRLAAGEEAPLLGLPLALKDILCTAGVRTTCSSRILENFVPPYDAAVVERLRAAGAVVLGKTNLDEFAMGSSTENSAFFPTRNPWDLARVPGGSSGGSAAAVAAGEAPAALGTDTGGSIRQPAALCGIVGLKPTYGRVSRYGLVAFASSLDQIGPMARTAADCALLLGVIAGHDPRDATALPDPVPDYLAELEGDLRGLRVGVPREYFAAGLEPGVEAAVRAAIAQLAALGASVDEVSLPHTEYGVAAYYLIAPAEASANLARYDGVKYGYSVAAPTLLDSYFRTRAEGFGPEVKRRIMLGTYALSAGYYDAYYLKAQKVRTLIKSDFDRAFERFDVLATPTSPTVAFRLGERVADPLAMYLSDVCTIPVNLAGLPGVSVPCGFVDGLPVGLQLIGPPLSEGRLLRVAHCYQQATDWHRRTPPLDEGG
ncbi:MAG TPA: Asp-tRNA(Asn)/Glu-tRNA(Gln) amidotransferase subunit GatA [Chloroflexota bacterium]|nr:Asp-tRNA(Asn)/Glu-tRNA(Gln) amidotransferase subunit GatA [Chloroflexota bacterium]